MFQLDDVIMSLPESLLIFCQLDPKDQTSVKFDSKYNFFHEYTFENVVCEMATFCPGKD